MTHSDKSEQRLIDELRQRIAELEKTSQQDEALRESEERYRMLAESTTDVIAIHDRNGTLLYGNPAGAAHFGIEPSSAVGMTQQEMFSPEMVRKHTECIGKVFQTGELFETDGAYRHGGDEIWVNTRLIPLRDERGQVTAVMSVSRNITDRKQAEEALRKAHDELERRAAETWLNEARLAAVLQLSHMTEASLKQITDFALEQAVALTRSKIGYLAFMNADETVLTMHSWSKEAMAECAMSDKPLVYPLETTGLWGEAARQRKPVVTNDYAAASPLKKGLPAGHVSLCRHMNVPIFDAGRVVVVAGVGNKDADYDEADIRQLTLLMEGMWTLVQRRQVQAELQRHRDHLERLVAQRTELLRQSEETHRGLLEASPDAILMMDLEGTILFASRQTRELVGLSEQDALVGQSVFDYVIEDDRRRLAENIPHLMQSGVRRNIEYTVLRQDNTRVPTEISSAINRDATGRPIAVMAVVRDITERKRAEEMLAREHRTLKYLLQSSDHERQLIAYEIHDGLAQQLAGAIMQMQTFNHLKEKQPLLAAKAYDAGMTMLQQGHFEARRLIAGVRPPILDESGVVAAVGHLVNEQGRLKGPKIEYRSRVDFDRLAPILENAIYRIAQEALANACQHSQSEKVRVSLVQREDRVRIEIRDWGIGFATKAVPENRYGLVGIRQRVRLLGGKCSIQSAAGKGTRITVELPVVVRE